MRGKYEGVSVLNFKEQDIMSDDCINMVANMINNCGGNRSQRRRIEKNFSKVENIMQHVQAKVDRSAYKEYQKAVDQNFIHFFAVLSLVLYENGQREDDSCEQISSMLEKVGNKNDELANAGYSTADIVKMVEDKIGIVLVPSVIR